MPNLRSAIESLATAFASSVLDAIRGASLGELLSDGGARPSRAAPTSPRARSSRRLARRSPEQIAKALERVIALVKTRKGGLRSEQIREELGLDKREVPRVLQEGLAKKKLKSRGRKRATTYTAA